MRIDYNIIWFENDNGWIKPALKNLSTFLEDRGFRLNPEILSDGKSLENLLEEISRKYRDVDIILMDYKLTGKENGDVLINKIRKTEVFTEIIFYSQNENVKGIIESQYGSFEGIYYAGRDNFLQKAKEVIHHTIKKVEDVESMRGLIMGAVSEIDSAMIDIVVSFIGSRSPEEKATISAKVFSKVEEHLKMKDDLFSKLNEKQKIEKLIKDPILFDADKKAQVTQMVIDTLGLSDLAHLTNGGFYDSYKNDVIKTRNNFAHVTVIQEDGVRKLKSSKSEDVFSDERCIEIRKTLITHIENMTKLKSILLK